MRYYVDLTFFSIGGEILKATSVYGNSKSVVTRKARKKYAEIRQALNEKNGYAHCNTFANYDFDLFR